MQKKVIMLIYCSHHHPNKNQKPINCICEIISVLLCEPPVAQPPVSGSTVSEPHVVRTSCVRTYCIWTSYGSDLLCLDPLWLGPPVDRTLLWPEPNVHSRSRETQQVFGYLACQAHTAGKFSNPKWHSWILALMVPFGVIHM